MFSIDGSPHIDPQGPSPAPPAGLHTAELDELIAIGMGIARKLGEAANAPDADLNKVSLDFTRVARAVRQTVALEAMLADQATVHAEAQKQLAAEEREELEDRCPWLTWDMSEAEYHAHQALKQRESGGTYLVGRAIKQWPKDEREAINLDFQEILADRPDLFADDRPLAEIIVGICEDLGIDPDWTALAKKDWDYVDLPVRRALQGRGDPDPELEPKPEPEPAPLIPAEAGTLPDMSMLYGVRLSSASKDDP